MAQVTAALALVTFALAGVAALVLAAPGSEGSAQASVMAPRSAPDARRAYLARTPLV